MLKKIDSKILLDAIKEPLRLLVLSVIPVALVYFETINAGWAVALIFILRFIDKYLHLRAPKGEAGGLVGF